jgi:hypothetical protein
MACGLFYGLSMSETTLTNPDYNPGSPEALSIVTLDNKELFHVKGNAEDVQYYLNSCSEQFVQLVAPDEQLIVINKERISSIRTF